MADATRTDGRLRNKPGLHTWTLDTTPLARVLEVIKRTGWEGVELRRVDFVRAAEAGQTADDVINLVRGSGLPVTAVGVEPGWMYADGDELKRLLGVFAEQCRAASALGASIVMSPVDRGTGSLQQAAARIREVGALARPHGVRVAIEFNSQAEQINNLARMRELLAAAAEPQCGLLLDTYHFGRSGGKVEALGDLTPGEILYFQYSDVAASGLQPGLVTDRLPPGKGVVPFREIFAILGAKGYTGYLSYEAPNLAAWARVPEEVAREALQATRDLL
jgi:sugar phosphate isomerase/epimerase